MQTIPREVAIQETWHELWFAPCGACGDKNEMRCREHISFLVTFQVLYVLFRMSMKRRKLGSNFQAHLGQNSLEHCEH